MTSPAAASVAPPAAGPPRSLAANPQVSTWLTIRADGGVELRVGKVEIGQGVSTALAQIAADELDVGLTRIRMVAPRTAAGPDEGVTAGSMSIRDSGTAVRLACAHARRLFVAAAAELWQVAEDDVTVDDGVLGTTDGSRHTTYAELADAVDLDVDVPADTRPKDAGQLRVVGTDAARLDLPDKIAGRPAYIADIRLPGLMFGRVLRPPSPGARLISLDESALEGTGARLVRDGSFVGVVGDDESEVRRAVDTVARACRWDESGRLPDENDLGTFLRAGPHETFTVLDDGTPGVAASRVHRSSYSRPFLAHASIAPSCGIARWESDGTVTVWSHSQGIHPLRRAIANALELPVGSVSVEHVQNAGCYGHNAADDAAFDAVLLARAVPGRPVQVVWSRRDELSWAPFGSAMAVDVEARVDDEGRPLTWTYDIWSQGHLGRPGYAGVPGLLAAAHLERPIPLPAAADPPSAAGGGLARNAVPIYAVGDRRITGHRLLETPIRSSAIRSLGAFCNVFAIESFIDELAGAAGRDPLTYRLKLLDDPRAQAVLTAAAQAAGWHDPSPDGHGRGLGFARYKGPGAYCAVVAEVVAEHDVRVPKLTVAVDVGRVVNPDGVRNQIEGGATQATSWTLRERVRFDRRRITSDDWESYPILRFGETPRIEVVLIDRPELPSVGSGEAAQGPTAAAIGNAVADAVGVRVRDLPITTEAVVSAIESMD